MAEPKIMKKSIILQVSCHRLYRWNNFLSGDSDTVNSLKSKGDYEAKLLWFDIDPKGVAIFNRKN